MVKSSNCFITLDGIKLINNEMTYCKTCKKAIPKEEFENI